MAEATRATAATADAIARQVAEQLAVAMETVRVSAEGARVETERVAAADRIALAAATRAELEAVFQASSAMQDARLAASEERADESAKAAADAIAKLAAFEAARQLLGMTDGTPPLTSTTVSWSPNVLARAANATFKGSEFDLNDNVPEFIAKLATVVSSSSALIEVLQIAASARFGDLRSVGPVDQEADAALWSVLLMSTAGGARELVQQYGAISRSSGVSSAVYAMHAISKTCEDTSVASMANALKAIFLGPSINLAKSPALAAIAIKVEVRKLSEQYNVTIASWLLFSAVFARVDRAAFGQIVETIGALDAREFDAEMLPKLECALQARWIALGSGKSKQVTHAVQANYASAGNQKLAQQRSQKRQENTHADSFRPTIQGGPRPAAVPIDATCVTCKQPFKRTFIINGNLAPFRRCNGCAAQRKAANVSANLLMPMPVEAEHNDDDGGPFFEQHDMFTVTAEQETAADEGRLQVQPLDSSPGIEIFRAPACVKSLQRPLFVDTATPSVLLSVETPFTPFDLAEEITFNVSVPGIFPTALTPKKKFEWVLRDDFIGAPAGFTSGGGPSKVPDKSVVAFDGAEQSGVPPTTTTTTTVEPGHPDFFPLASGGNSEILTVTDKSATAVSGIRDASLVTPVHVTDAVESVPSGLSAQFRDGTLENFSVTNEPVTAVDGVPYAVTTPTGATPPRSSGLKDSARPLTTTGISFRSIVSGTTSRDGGPGSGN